LFLFFFLYLARKGISFFSCFLLFLVIIPFASLLTFFLSFDVEYHTYIPISSFCLVDGDEKKKPFFLFLSFSFEMVRPLILHEQALEW